MSLAASNKNVGFYFVHGNSAGENRFLKVEIYISVWSKLKDT